MKSTYNCPHCPKVLEVSYKSGDNMGPARLKAIAANHTKAFHPEHYVAKKPKPQVVDNFKLLAEHQDAQPPKRPYTRKAKPAVGVNFCPCCGCNLRAVSVAMGL